MARRVLDASGKPLAAPELVVEASMVGAPCPDGAEGVDALLISPRAMPWAASLARRAPLHEKRRGNRAV